MGDVRGAQSRSNGSFHGSKAGDDADGQTNRAMRVSEKLLEAANERAFFYLRPDDRCRTTDSASVASQAAIVIRESFRDPLGALVMRREDSEIPTTPLTGNFVKKPT